MELRDGLARWEIMSIKDNAHHNIERVVDTR